MGDRLGGDEQRAKRKSSSSDVGQRHIVSEDNKWNTAPCSRTNPDLPHRTSLTDQAGVNVYLAIQVPTCSPSVLVDSLISKGGFINDKQKTALSESRYKTELQQR
jgi:hypothetical protein